ncbi:MULTISPECIES: copper chaperone PCu(A)C [unclassified Streptomyces]|uniref:copper chaperone PCu(A)C n=1 Tax=unclassified Streptomyces TaxID=2593676 RepID=UPI002DD7C255|nr:copper chaperone PCu(A)C [Streptomyces sp. NBC_01750]WSA98633.1 copper chaperone PCu(A)C [Streptomyces sp. NBC_01794]WSD36805.1 copper chaperone PCu(A)C [Streptomyces sp. NBC_01750]
MTEQNPWRPTRRRFTDILLAALAPVAACSVALGGLTTWVGAGNAGTPARIDVDPGRVYLPDGDSRYTAAFFVIANSGNAEDRLTAVTSSAVLGEITVPRHSSIGSGAAYRDGVNSATVPAGSEQSMSQYGLNLTLRPKSGWRAGDIVPFTLHFEHSGRIETVAVVVRPSRPGEPRDGSQV